MLIDIREEDPVWQNWSYRAVAEARLAGELATSAVTVGELAIRGGSLDQLLTLCRGLAIRIVPLSASGAYRAALAQRLYRAAGGRREKLLGDFMIGGEAEASGAVLLTRDPTPYRRYFPTLKLTTPDRDT